MNSYTVLDTVINQITAEHQLQLKENPMTIQDPPDNLFQETRATLPGNRHAAASAALLPKVGNTEYSIITALLAIARELADLNSTAEEVRQEVAAIAACLQDPDPDTSSILGAAERIARPLTELTRLTWNPPTR